MSDLKDLREDDLLTMTEELMDENEDLKNQNSKAQQTISKLSSENSMLQSKLQEKVEKIVSLNEHIGKLNESDLILKKNEELVKQNQELQQSEQNARKEAEDLVSAARKEANDAITASKEKYDQMVQNLDLREKRVTGRESAVADRSRNIDTQVERRASYMVDDQIRKFEYQYGAMRKAYFVMVYLTLFYGIITTLIQAWKIKIISSDLISFFIVMADGTALVDDWIYTTSDYVGSLVNMFLQGQAALICYWIIRILIVMLIVGIIGVSITVALIKYVEFFRKKQWDEITGFAVLVDLAVTIFLAEEIKSLVPVNLILMMLLIFAGYSFVRGVIHMNKCSC